MMWHKCELQRNTGYIPDMLGNIEPGEWETLLTVFCRYTPWSADNVALEGREVTRDEQQYVIPAPISELPVYATHALIDGKRRFITSWIDLAPRYTAIRVKAYKEVIPNELQS